MDEAQRIYYEFEDVVTIGAFQSGLYMESRNLCEFSSRVFAVFAVASRKRVKVAETLEQVETEANKIHQAEYRQAFIDGCRSRIGYRRKLQTLNEGLLSLTDALGPAGLDNLAVEVVCDPWFGGFSRFCDRKEDVHDPSVDYAQLQRFWADLSLLPLTPDARASCSESNSDSIKAKLLAAMNKECEQLINIKNTDFELPLIYFRRLLLYELCNYWEEQLALEELSHVYGAMRVRCSQPSPQPDAPLSPSKLRIGPGAAGINFEPGSQSRWDCLKWYTSLPLPVFGELVERCNITATVLLLECGPSSEDPTDYSETLPKFGYAVRSSMIHMAKLYDSNTLRRRNFEDEILDAKFWSNKRAIEDLDPETLEPLRKAMSKALLSPSPGEPSISLASCPPPYYLEDNLFYIDCNVMNLELDFLSYCVSGQSLFGLMICSGSLDPQMKSRLIALDSRQQQMERGRIVSLGPIFFMPYLTLTIRRHRILDDALDKLVVAQVWENNETLKSPLKIKFDGEDGVDEGGVTKEFFQLLIEQILNPDYGMFIQLPEQGLYYFMPDAFGTMLQFELIGIVLGLAVYNHVILDIHFPHFIYKKLLSSLPGAVLSSVSSAPSPPASRNIEIHSRVLSRLSVPDNEKNDTADMSYVNASKMTTYQIVQRMAQDLPPYRPSIEDLQELYPETARGLRQLLMMDDPQIVESLSLTFSVTIDRFGERIERPLKKPDGIQDYPVNMPVTIDNRSEYIKAVLNHHLVFSVNKEFSAFYKGFHRCCGGPALVQLTPDDLHLLICGAPGDLDIASLKAGAKYVDGYSEDSDVIRWFWEIAESLTQDEKKKLLFFITGSDRTPVSGLESLKLTISKAGGDLNRLPTAHTCFNHFLLPPYESKEDLERFLRIAIEYRHGFGLR